MLLVSRWGGSGWGALPGQKEGGVCTSSRQSQGNPHDGPGLPITLQFAHSHPSGWHEGAVQCRQNQVLLTERPRVCQPQTLSCENLPAESGARSPMPSPPLWPTHRNVQQDRLGLAMGVPQAPCPLLGWGSAAAAGRKSEAL